MEHQKPSIGRIVHYQSAPGVSVPAIITRVHSDECVNVTVFPDAHPPCVETSVVLGTGERMWCWPPRVG